MVNAVKGTGILLSELIVRTSSQWCHPLWLALECQQTHHVGADFNIRYHLIPRTGEVILLKPE